MNFKIACPWCQHAFSIKDPKPGKFKPKCSACSEAFALVVEAGDPVQLKVGKIAKPVALQAPVASPIPEDASLISRPNISGIDQTMGPASSVLPISRPSHVALDVTAPEQPALPIELKVPSTKDVVGALSGVDVTMEQPALPPTLPFGAQGTMLHESTANSGAAFGNQASAGREFSVNEATMESQPGVASAGSAALALAAKGPSGEAGQGPSAGSKAKDASKIPATASASSVPSRLGGYRIVSELGAGGMGSVYLAKQISLDRSCALKTIQAHWAQNPRVIARFIREAYAAAQLTHHNVVQIYDLGQEGGTNFFSMELVSGGSLDDQLKSKGKLPPKLASTLILQAARGLKFAHDHGMVHRDIKPANLMMTADGLVKVADMGLIKTPDAEDVASDGEADVQTMMLASARSHVTAVGSSMGTPAYMSPEQSMDAASVDKRADIYSLGCTFYALLVGKPPFDGSTMLEVISKHRGEKIVRPDRIIAGLPTAVGDIIEKMTEKKPDDRYQDLEEVINDIEVYLELREDTSKATIKHDPANLNEVESAEQKASSARDSEAKKPVAPTLEISTEHAGQLQVAAKRFNSSPLLIARRIAPIAWISACAAMTLLAVLFALWSSLSLIGEGAKSLAAKANSAVQGLAGKDTVATKLAEGAKVAEPAAAGLSKSVLLYANLSSWLKSAVGYCFALFLAPLSAIAFAGKEGRSPLASRWRASFVNGGLLEWIYWGLGIVVAILAIHFLGLWIPFVVACIIGIGAGAGYYFGIDKVLANVRKPAVDQAQGILRQLRLRGTDENAVREVAAKHFGKNWEEFYESLFGYDSMRTMRSKLQESKRADLKVFQPRRDRMIDKLDARLSEARREHEQKVLRKTGKAEMVAAGVSDAEADKRADAMAASMVEAASETRQAMFDMATGKLTAQGAEAKRQRIKQMMVEARTGKLSPREVRSRSLDRLLGQLLGSKFRFICAAAMLVGGGMWMQSNQQELQSYWQQAQSTAQSTLDSLKNTTLDSKGMANATSAISSATEQTKAQLTSSPKKIWKKVGLGLVSEKNVIFVIVAGVLMLVGSLMYGWKKSLILIPIALVLCLVPLML
jgi:serine/threonine protein kinase